MILKWYQPFSFTEWLKRLFSFLNLSVLVFSALLLFSEFRFDWCERLLGTYLVSTNAQRPEKGAIWELGRDTMAAHESLKEIISRKADTQQTALSADSFSGLTQSLRPGEWVILDKDQFKRLYRTLTPTNARRIMEPARLVWLLNGRTTDRIFCEGLMDGLKFYFINAENRVVHQADLARKTLAAIERKEYLVPGRLETFDGFDDRIFPAALFFESVFKLPPEMLHDLIQDPELLLDQDGRIRRVGIWNEAQDGFIQLGFEFDAPPGEDVRVLFMGAREWAVWQLGLILKGEHQ